MEKCGGAAANEIKMPKDARSVLTSVKKMMLMRMKKGYLALKF